MNPYVAKINDVVNYIEDHITTRLTLEGLSCQFAFSEYHFSRLFKIFVGKSMKQYILGRKLSHACELLRNSTESVIDISYDLGFEYPEVFSRAFKNYYGISPTDYRRNYPAIQHQPKATIVERSILNYKGSLTLNAEYVEINDLSLYGMSTQVYEQDPRFGEILNTACERFMNAAKVYDRLKQDYLYAVVNCHGEDNGLYTVFHGMKLEQEEDEVRGGLELRRIPNEWYACFSYYGEMLELVSTFVEDMYRWIMIKEIEVCSNGIGMINIFDSRDSKKVRILIPVLHPK